jgi:hypothetical protein
MPRLQNRFVVTVMMESVLSTITTSAPNTLTGDAHSVVKQQPNSRQIYFSVLTYGDVSSDSSQRGPNGTADVSASVDNQSDLSDERCERIQQWNAGKFHRRDSTEFVQKVHRVGRSRSPRCAEKQ